ncbi:MAG TPA: hypothetical protein VK787_15310 [Puia sp.]|jgi:hypothetical protein|nr:hypothetical protein [Puia sp.]
MAVLERTSEIIDAAVPLSNVEKKFYENLLRELDDYLLDTDKESAQYKAAKNIIANNIYLLYERIKLNKVREIDYTTVRNFGVRYKDFVRDILGNTKGFPLESLDSFLQVNVDLLESAMYRKSDMFNKNIFH